MPCSTAGPPGCPAGSRPHRAVQRAGLVAVGGAQVGRVDPAARADGHPGRGDFAVRRVRAGVDDLRRRLPLRNGNHRGRHGKQQAEQDDPECHRVQRAARHRRVKGTSMIRGDAGTTIRQPASTAFGFIVDDFPTNDPRGSPEFWPCGLRVAACCGSASWPSRLGSIGASGRPRRCVSRRAIAMAAFTSPATWAFSTASRRWSVPTQRSTACACSLATLRAELRRARASEGGANVTMRCHEQTVRRAAGAPR